MSKKSARTRQDRMDAWQLVVGVGVSADSHESLSRFLSQLDPDSPLTLVFMPLSAADDIAALVNVLRSATPLLVKIAEAGDIIRPGGVYVAPCGMSIVQELDEATLAYAEDGHTSAPLDQFFHSLADGLGRFSVGLLMAGGIAGGQLGLKAISAAGGLSLVLASTEEAATAQVNQAQGDLELAPDRIAQELASYAKHLRDTVGEKRQKEIQVRIHDAIPTIAELLHEATNHNFQHYKRSTLARRILRRMQILKLTDVEDYIAALRDDKEESSSLFRELLIGVTEFFRDPEAFDVLAKEVLPRLFEERNADAPVRIWVPGCSTGEEAYTLAILCREQMERLAKPPEVQIFATDINERALRSARRGLYAVGIEQDVEPERLERFFSKRADGYLVKQEIREMVLFSVHSLISDPPFSRLDLISCRNLLIYLGPHLQKKLVPLFHYALRPEGFLFLGPSENIASHRELFRPIDAKRRISQKKATSVHRTEALALAYDAHSDPPSQQPSSSHAELLNVMQRIVLDEFSPKSVVVDEHGRILCASSDMGKYMSVSAGEFQNRIIKMVKPGLRGGVRSALKEARETCRKVVLDNLSVRVDGMMQRVMLTVQPMPEMGEGLGLFMIIFDDVGLPLVSAKNSANADNTGTERTASEVLISQLESELESARSELEKSVQDMETANEELKASNEELLSLNEELQSANEELETSKEDVQAGANDLAGANSDLENLLRCTQIATIFLDTRGSLRRFTPAAAAIYNLKPGDLNRPLSDITHRMVAMPPLPSCDSVAASAEPVESEIQSVDGQWYLRRILPYLREDELDGVVLTFIDITERKRNSMRLATEHSVTRILADADSFNEVIPTILQSIRETLRAEFCALWLLDTADNKLKCEEVSHGSSNKLLDHFSAESQRAPFDKGVGLPGRVWETGEAQWIEDIASETRYQRKRLAHQAGLSTAVAMPIIVGSRFLGVIEIYTAAQQQREQGLLDMLQAIGREIGQFIRRCELSAEMRIQEARKTAILESALDCIITMDVHGRIVDFNPAAERTFGYRSAEVQGELLSETIIPPEFRDAHSTGLQRFLSSGESRVLGRRVELTAMRADGTRFPIELAINAVNVDGVAPFFTGYLRDISEQKLAAQAITDRDERITALLNSTAEGIYGVDLDGNCTFANKACAKLLGYAKAEDLVGKQMHALVHHTRADGSPYPNGECPIYLAFRSGERIHSDEELFWRADGSSFAVEYWSYPLVRQGKTVGSVVTFLDVTERRRWEVELEEREAQLRRVIDNMLGFVGVLDLNGVLEEANAGALLAGGVSADDVIGKKFWDCSWWSYDPEIASQLEQAVAKALAGETVRYDVAIRTSGDNRMMIDFMLVPVRGPQGNITHLIPSGVDITDRKRAEFEVAQRERHFNLALEAGRLGAWQWEIDADRVIWSDHVYKIFGLARSQFDGTLAGFLDKVHPEDRQSVQKQVSTALQDSSSEFEVEHRTHRESDGALIWTMCRGTIERAPDGQPMKIVGVVGDITERKHRELALAFFAKLQIELAELEATEEIIRVASQRVSDYLDLSRCILVAIDDEARTAEVFYDHCASDAASLQGGVYAMADYYSDAERHQLKNGELLIIEDANQRTSPPGSDARLAELDIQALMVSPCLDGQRLTFLLAVTKEQPYRWRPHEIELLKDLTTHVYMRIERARAEAALQESERILRDSEDRLTMALQAGGLAAWEWNPQESIWTDDVYELLGISPELPAAPELFFQYVHPEDLEGLKAGWQRAVDGEDCYREEFRIIRPDGEIRWLVGTGEVHRDESGEVVRILGLNWDSTREHEAAEALRKNERIAREASLAKSAFIANMSHEIRTPMTAVLGYADLLAAKEQDREKAEYLQIIKRNGNFLLDIINDILDLSKIEAGRMEVDRERFSILELIADVQSMMNIRAHEKNLRFDAEFEGRIPRLIESDSKRLKQILVNLIGNAIKFTDAGSVRLIVRFVAEDKPMLEFEVADTGIGMTEQQQSRLFQPFSQGDASVTRAFGGTGLGLAISWRLAEILGGTIRVESEYDKGSTFVCTIDAGRVQDSDLILPGEQTVSREGSPAEPDQHLSCHVLVVDDRRDVRFLTKHLLTGAGATVELAEDGQEAVEVVKEMLSTQSRHFDLILLDMQMPRLDGYQTAVEIRKLGFGLPIIALTADAMHGDMNRCIESGCNSYLSKPIDKRALLEIVSHYTQAE